MKKKLIVSAVAAMLAMPVFAQVNPYSCGLPDSADTIMGLVPDEIGGGSPLVGVPRVDTYCAIRASGAGGLGFLLPAEDTELKAAFYFLGDVATKLFSATTFDGIELISVSYDSGHVIVATDGDPSFPDRDLIVLPAYTNKWNFVEIQWNRGYPGNVWVNPGTEYAPLPSDWFMSGDLGNVQRVFFGALEDIGTQEIFFDRFLASRQGGQFGVALLGDSNNDEAVNSGDVISIINEFFGAGLSSGTPDCNLDSNVNSGDVICIINTFFTQ